MKKINYLSFFILILISLFYPDDVMKNLKQLKPKGKVLYFWYVGVKPEAQGKGQGTQLIEQIIADYPEYHIHLQTSNHLVLIFTVYKL